MSTSAWAVEVPDRPEPYPKDPQARREQMLRRALREGRPIREAGRLLAIARPREDVLGAGPHRPGPNRR